ncbi:MAG: Veg family protein [Bacillota bacterium]
MKSVIFNSEVTRTELQGIVNIPFVIRVNRGRNRIETVEGYVESVYPNIFTIRTLAGELNTFSYADIYSKQVRFVQRKIKK